MRPIPLLCALAAAVVIAHPAAAATFTVDSTADDVDLLPGDGICATSAGTCTLRAAIQEANALPRRPDRVELPAGTYLLTIPGQAEDLGATGDLDVRDDLEIAGAGADTTIIDGNGLDRVLEVPVFGSPIPSLVLHGLTIQHGSIPNSAGGGVVAAGSVHAFDVILRENLASTGGGMYIDGEFEMERSLVADNTSYAGGGLQLWGDSALRDCTIRGNHTYSNGGGILALALGDAELVLERCTVTDNHASPDGNGGGIHFANEGVTLINTTVSGNTAGRDGGGIYRSAVYRDDDELEATGPLHLRNATITANRADDDGNGSGDGGGIFSAFGDGTEVVMRNSIVAGNSDNGGEAPDCAPRMTVEGRNLVQDATGCALTGAVAGVTSGVSPLLGPLHDNGGATLTHALLSGSPAIDAGDPAVPGTGGTSCESEDQRGVTRPQPTECDLGAYEVAVALCDTIATGCTHGGGRKTRVQIKRSATKPSQMQWTWRGAPIAAGEFGDPLGATDYVLCIYDASSGTPMRVLEAIIPGGPCGVKPCWKSAGTKLGYRNRAATPNGVTTVQLKTGSTNQAAITVKAAGDRFAAPVLPFQQEPNVVVQLRRTDGGTCWDATFSTHTANRADAFDARGD